MGLVPVEAVLVLQPLLPAVPALQDILFHMLPARLFLICQMQMLVIAGILKA
jgi:hypothetical protein